MSHLTPPPSARTDRPRVVVVSAPLVGHLRPLLPLARGFRAVGAEVRILTAGDAARLTPDATDVLPQFRFGRFAARAMIGRLHHLPAELRGRADLDVVGAAFGAVNAAMAAPVADAVRRWRPDLVVYEPLGVAGALAAATHGVPSCLFENTLVDAHRLVHSCLDHRGLRRIARYLRLQVWTEPIATLTSIPPSLRPPAPDRFVLVRPPGAGGAPAAPSSGTIPVRRSTRILVSSSTVAGPGAASHLRPILVAAGQLDAEIVLITPPARLLASRSLPNNVRITGSVNIEADLADCSAIVHHEGAGTVLAALAAGVPQLAVFGPGDRRYNAELVARRGAGLALPARRVTAEALLSLCRDPSLRWNAQEVSREIAAMPEPADVAADLLRRVLPVASV